MGVNNNKGYIEIDGQEPEQNYVVCKCGYGQRQYISYEDKKLLMLLNQEDVEEIMNGMIRMKHVHLKNVKNDTVLFLLGIGQNITDIKRIKSFWDTVCDQSHIIELPITEDMCYAMMSEQCINFTYNTQWFEINLHSDKNYMAHLLQNTDVSRSDARKIVDRDLEINGSSRT